MWSRPTRPACCCRRCQLLVPARSVLLDLRRVTLNPMTKPARKPETMIMEVIYRFHPMFADEVPHLAGRYR